MDYKYIILFPTEGTYADTIKGLMDGVHMFTGKEPPYKKLIPHVTFHRPIRGITEEKIVNITHSVALKMRKTRMTTNAVYHFGKEYVVLPIHATRTLAGIWIGIQEILSQVPEYEHEPFDYDNTLHITIGEGLSEVFDASWANIRDWCTFDEITIPVEKIEVWRKALDKGSAWERVVEIPLPA